MVIKSKRARRRAGAAVRLAEIGVAAPQVIAHRLARMASAGPTISARDRKEFAGMVTEKQTAFAQAWMGMFAQTFRMQQQFAIAVLSGATPRQHTARAKSAALRIVNAGLGPIHRKAVANARRLARTKLR